MRDGELAASTLASGLDVGIAVNALGLIEMLFNSTRSNAKETEVTTTEQMEVSSKLQEATSAIGGAVLVGVEHDIEVTVASAGGLTLILRIRSR